MASHALFLARNDTLPLIMDSLSLLLINWRSLTILISNIGRHNNKTYKNFEKDDNSFLLFANL